MCPWLPINDRKCLPCKVGTNPESPDIIPEQDFPFLTDWRDPAHGQKRIDHYFPKNLQLRPLSSTKDCIVLGILLRACTQQAGSRKGEPNIHNNKKRQWKTPF